MSSTVCRLAAATLAICACDAGSPPATANPGEPFPTLSESQRQEFLEGRRMFTRAFAPDEGLGPAFNEASCVFCHDLPAPGGAGADPVRKVSRFADGRCDLLVEHGGDMLQTQITPALKAQGYDVEGIPPAATAVASIMPPALYGAGLIDAIPEARILESADPEDADGDGISGRPGRAGDGSTGRFGWKAGFARLRDFVESAFSGEMGLTTAGFPDENPIGAHGLPAGADPAADPEITPKVVDQVALYVSLLAPPHADTTSVPRDSLRLGRRVFDRIGCAACHTPEMTTAASDVEPLDRKRFALYSDLLLHDMGPENASVCAPAAEPAEWRTTPLIGLHLRINLWHDGRAHSIESAIRAHGGEATRAREAFMMLSPPDRAILLRFLGSL